MISKIYSKADVRTNTHISEYNYSLSHLVPMRNNANTGELQDKLDYIDPV